ncbi:glycosyltransferase [Bradyrhizobium niftali]|uniref:Glycosyltransferase n=1 Tax=Bradyrhizobium niftali TaxID=2560055 RepID=A0A4Y9LJH5_9BRAD|nr:glycosyltransferase [Bradyrhizobium niftali]TFV43136.1 glycosyltransferase [Bradyrhizobium niftali]
MPTRKTVLIYRNELLPISETFIKEQILALTEWRAVLVGCRKLKQLALEDLDVRIVEPQNRSLQSRLLWKANKLFGTVPPYIKRALQVEQPSLIHAHFGPDALDAWPIAKALSIPMLVTLHGYDINTYREWWEAGSGGSKMQSYPRRLLELSAQPRVRFIAVSDAIRGRAIEYGIPAEKVAVHYIGIDVNTYTPGPIPITQRPPNVVFVGRLVEKKGCQYLIEAMASVQKAIPTARLIVVGDGPLRPHLERLAQTLGTHVEFRGAQAADYVKRELHAARLLSLPSVTAENGDAEGFGLVLLEAQASGVPVVTSARGGAAEGVLDGVTGHAFPERDVRALAARLTSLLKEDNVLQRMAEQGPIFVSEEFNLSYRARLLEELYDAHAVSPQ